MAVAIIRCFPKERRAKKTKEEVKKEEEGGERSTSGTRPRGNSLLEERKTREGGGRNGVITLSVKASS